MPDTKKIVKKSSPAKAPAKPPVETIGTREAAKKIGTDARSLRIFLRSKNGPQGKRYEFNPSDIPALAKEFKASVQAAAAEV